MSLANYSDLKAAVPNWVDHADLSSFLSDYITLAEASIKDRLNIRHMMQRAQAETSITSRRIALPESAALGDFLKLLTIHFNEDPLSVLTQRSPEQIHRYYVDQPGRPFSFAVIGEEIVMERVSDIPYTLEVEYYAFKALSDSNPTNVILTKYPDLYLYECISVAAIMLQDNNLQMTAELKLFGDPRKRDDVGIYGRIELADEKATFTDQKLYALPRTRTP